MQRFQELRCLHGTGYVLHTETVRLEEADLRSGCSAHIQNDMVRFHVKEEWREHRDSFLSSYISLWDSTAEITAVMR